MTQVDPQQAHAIAVGRALAMAASLDPRMPQPDPEGVILTAWIEALHDVPGEAVQRAVVEYYRSDRYAQKRETIAPADVVQWWNARRRPTEGERTGLNRATGRKSPRAGLDPQRIHDGVDRVLAALGARRAIRAGEDPGLAVEIAQGEAAVRREFLSRPCSYCGAREGSPCVVPATGLALTKTPAHDARMNAAQVAAATTSREQALAALERARPELESVQVAAEALSSPQ
jgi:hypothetical protein